MVIAARDKDLTLALLAVLRVSSLAELGMRGSVLRFVGAAAGERQWDTPAQVLRRSVAIVQVAATALSALLWWSAPRLSVEVLDKAELAAPRRLMAPGVLLLALGKLFVAYTQAFCAIKYRAVVQDVVQLLVQVGLAFVLIPAGLGVRGGVRAYITGGVVALALLGALSTRLAPLFGPVERR